jgi:hypothetical protein
MNEGFHGIEGSEFNGVIQPFSKKCNKNANKNWKYSAS